MRKEDFKRFEQSSKLVERQAKNNIRLPTPPRLNLQKRWFFTTGTMTTATVTGTSVSTAVLTLGSATARICHATATGVLKPDTGASDITIYNPVVIASSISAGAFFQCNFSDGVWQADLSSKC